MKQPFEVTCYVLKHKCGHDASYHYDVRDFKTILEMIDMERANICPKCWEKNTMEVSANASLKYN